jgi:hypothetical protein
MATTAKRNTVIPIDENWRIVGYLHGWRIEQPRTRKGKRDWKPFKWFTTFEGALQELGEIMVRTSGAQTLAEALEELKIVSTKLSQVLTLSISKKPKGEPS